jgi:ATP-binding cassette, subfamily B, bacterial MsbA
VRRTSRRVQEELAYLSHITIEAFTGHRIVKAFGAEAHEASRFQRASQRLYRTNLKVTSTVSVLPPLMEFLGGVAVVGLIAYGSRKIGSGELTQGDFFAFVVAAFMMYGPIKKLSRVNTNLQQAIAASERIFDLLDTHSEVSERPGATALAPLRQHIEFREVSFQYEDGSGKYVLRDVSFGVEAGQVIAIVGLSGAGKTTLVNLLPRFFDVTSGAILMDGVDVRDVTLRSLRAQIGIVTQETVLFDESIASNIAYGSPGASRAQIEAAARAAHAHDFVTALPKQYDTWIGERGQRLSGGQRQRLAIARALLKNSPILILDEATSSLDAESERLVQEALANLMRDRTSFVIAHRLSTVRRADKIIALERGRVAEIGRHEELLSRPNGVYAKLYAQQIFERQPEEAAANQP